LVGGEAWAENPRLVIAEPWHGFVRLWAACRGGMGGIAHWPDAGGVNDQAAWVVDGFAVLGNGQSNTWSAGLDTTHAHNVSIGNAAPPITVSDFGGGASANMPPALICSVALFAGA
jgi:hypothetical protein